MSSVPTSSNSEPWTVDRLLQWTTNYLQQHGSSQPRLEADLLLAHALGCERIDLYAGQFKTEPSEEVRATFRNLVKRRAEGEPTAYLLGEKEFFSLTFEVTRDVLIPRPETEFLVIAVLDEAAKQARDAEPADDAPESEGAEQEAEPVSDETTVWRIIDVGTGSGAVAISLAKHLPQADIWAVDISEAALEVAQRNAESLEASNVRFAPSDLLASIEGDQKFHFIVSNPPYISQPEFTALPSLIKDYEPTVALLGGRTGCEVIARFIPQAADHLELGGTLLMEISPMIESAVVDLVEQEPRFDKPEVIKDLAGLPRVVKAKRRADPWPKRSS